MKSIIFGLGSIGKSHLYEMMRFSELITVVDPRSDVKRVAESIVGNKVRIEHKKTANHKKHYSNYDLAVIANWGPDHFDYFKELVEAQTPRILIEKPLSDSLFEIDSMKKYSLSSSSRIFASFPLDFSVLPQKLIDLQKNSTLGRLMLINVSGGAKCLATNGIHYLSLAHKIFDSLPEYVISELNDHPINPRSSKFSFLEGIASWRFPGERFLNISFSNKSRVGININFVFEMGFGSIFGENLELKGIDEIPQGSPITKTLVANRLISNGAAYFNEGQRPLIEIYNSLFSNCPSNFLDAVKVNQNLIAALIASKDKSGIKLPLDLSHQSPLYKMKWGIS